MVIVQAHRKNELKQWKHTRTIAYCNLVASWQHPKKRPPSIERYMPLEDLDQGEDAWTEERLAYLEKAQRAYKDKVNAKKIVN